MKIGIQAWEIKGLVEEAVDEGAREHNIGESLSRQQQIQVQLAITKVIAKNNELIIDALTDVGIKLKVKEARAWKP